MSQATELNTSTPMPSAGDFQFKMQGMLCAAIYTGSFVIAHSAARLPFLDTMTAAVFLAGLVVIPAIIGLPLAALRRMLAGQAEGESSVAAFLPFAQFALYGLAALLIWLATREAHHWIFA